MRAKLILLTLGILVVLSATAALARSRPEPAPATEPVAVRTSSVTRFEVAAPQAEDEAAAPAAPAAPDGKPVATPPGTVLIPTRQRVAIGTDVDIVATFVKSDISVASNLISETPAHTMRVDEFHLMVNEVTNEQYQAFVKATGRRPPVVWGAAAIDVAQSAYADEVGRARAQAQEAGKRPPEGVAFDRADWWAANWQGAEWEMPEKVANRPVGWVDFADARAYAVWAGMRLMTEFEFQSAGRGEKKSIYPWGDEWKDSGAATAQGQQANPIAVGSRPDGATPEGVFDLVGNAWEWTSSRFEAYPKYEAVDFEVGPRGQKRTVPAKAQWNGDYRVVVGGSVQNSSLAARLATRRPSDRRQRTNALGFRAAASPRPGFDRAMGLGLNPGVLGAGSADVQRTVGIDRWYRSAGSVKLPNYAVVDAYECLFAVPAEKLEFLSLSEFNTATLTWGPQPLFVLSTSLPLTAPALAPGDYVVSYRAPGSDRSRPVAGPEADDVQQSQDEAPTVPSALAKLDTRVPNYVFSKLSGEPVAVLAGVGTVRFERPDRAIGNGRVGVEVDAGGKRGADFATITVVIPPRTTSQSAFIAELPLKFASGALAGPWRR